MVWTVLRRSRPGLVGLALLVLLLLVSVGAEWLVNSFLEENRNEEESGGGW